MFMKRSSIPRVKHSLNIHCTAAAYNLFDKSLPGTQLGWKVARITATSAASSPDTPSTDSSLAVRLEDGDARNSDFRWETSTFVRPVFAHRDILG